MNIHIPSKALRVTAKSIAFAGPDASARAEEEHRVYVIYKRVDRAAGQGHRAINDGHRPDAGLARRHGGLGPVPFRP